MKIRLAKGIPKMEKPNLRSESAVKIVWMTLGIMAMALTAGPVWAEPDAAVKPAPVQLAPPAVENASNVTLDFKEADINTVLRVISLKSKINIVAGPEVKGTVTIRLEDVPWEKALDVILRTYDYVYERSENIIRVTTRDKMEQEPVVTQTFVLNYTTASEIMNAVKDMLTERGRIKTADRTNMVIITDIPTNLYRVSEVVKKLDKVTPQAYIDSKIIRTAIGLSENLGIDWNPAVTVTGSKRPTTLPFATSNTNNNEIISDFFRQFFPINAGATAISNPADPRNFPEPDVQAGLTKDQFKFGTLDFSSFSAILQMLKSRSNTKVVSNPRIVVLNNQTAKVQVGQQIPLPTFERNQTTGSMDVTGFSFRDVGVVLNVTPHINSEEEILVDLSPEVSSKGDSISFGTSFSVPSFDITTAKTQVLIQSGQTIAIGGLLTDNDQISETKVPYLSSIPFVGKLFRAKRQTAGSGNAKVETLFFVTVTMVDTQGQPSGERAAKKAFLKNAAQNKADAGPVAGKVQKATPDAPSVEKTAQPAGSQPAAGEKSPEPKASGDGLPAADV